MIDSAYKIFSELPDLETSVEQPHPSENICVIPVFKDVYFNEYNFPAFLKSAIYSQRSFLLNTDAHKQNVQIKLYIEHACKDIATPILDRNKLTEQDVLWFYPHKKENKSPWAKLSKKLCLYWDNRLKQFERVIYWDSDMFKTKDIFDNIWAILKTKTPTLTFLKTTLMLRRDWRPSMIRSCVKNTHLDNTPIQEIFTNAGLGRVLQNVQGQLRKCIGGFSIFPARHFNKHHQDFLNWMQSHGKHIGDDEICISLAAHQFGVFLQDTFHGWRHTDINKYLNGDTHTPMIHGKSDHEEYKNILMDLVDLDWVDSHQ